MSGMIDCIVEIAALNFHPCFSDVQSLEQQTVLKPDAITRWKFQHFHGLQDISFQYNSFPGKPKLVEFDMALNR